MSRLRSALRNLFRKQAVERQLDDELRAYVDIVTDEKIAAGMSARAARRTALAEFGGIEPVKEAVREHRSGAGLERLWQDVRYGSRRLWRNPGLTVTALLTLALSIGANTAMFSVVNALLLKNLPYPNPESLGTVYTRVTGPGGYNERHKINGEEWELLRDRVPSLIAAISSGRTAGVNLQAETHVQFLHAGRISAQYLDVLAIHPFIGRKFSDAEDRVGGPKATILSYRLWHTAFSADPKILGRTILLKGEPHTVVGVLAEGATTPLNTDLYTALQASRKGEGAGTNFEVITRLHPGATWQQADAEINRAWAVRTQRFELEGNPSAQVTWYSVPLQTGQAAKLRPQVLALMVAAGLILLIACANLAGLTLIGTLRRAQEVATRLALGASQWQIQRQLWIENLVLALLGGTFGVAAGFVALRGLLMLLPEHFLPVTDLPLDRTVLAFTLVISLVTSVLFGMLPALATRRLDLRSAVASRGATAGDRLRLRQVLIVIEVAVTVVLLAASGLLIRTLIHLQTLPPGFNPSGVMAATVSLDDARFHDAPAFRKLLSQSLAAMRQIPAVQAAAVGLSLPYERSLIMGALRIRDGKEAGQTATTDETYVTPGYFEALQIPILAGRSFTEADGPDSQAVAIVNRTFARRFFGGANPVGRHVDKNMLIVGLVEDVAMAPGIDAVAPLTGEQTMYVPAAQVDAKLLAVVHAFFQPSWIVRTARPVEGLSTQMQRAMAGVDNLPFSGFYSMHDLLARTLAMQRIEVALLSAMSALALLLSAVGIFALVANTVAQRTREIGIRMALGSTTRQAMVHIGAPVLGAPLAGLLTGLLLCAGTLKAMRSVLYGVAVYDGPTLFAVVLTLAAVTVIATAAPILRIARIDPATTLRDE
jgi:predicted permease